MSTQLFSLPLVMKVVVGIEDEQAVNHKRREVEKARQIPRKILVITEASRPEFAIVSQLLSELRYFLRNSCHIHHITIVMILTRSFRRLLFPTLFSNTTKNLILFLSFATNFIISQRTTKQSVLHRRMNSTASSKRQPPVYVWNEDAESLEYYRPGGYHPVHLGDTFSAGRYQVIHKLGYGSYSTVWLCKDIQQQRYVSVKVTVSESDHTEQPQKRYQNVIFQALRNGDPRHPGRRFVIHLLDEFTIDGPNGRHQCFVFPVALNSVYMAKQASVSDNFLFPPQVARSIATQALLALSYIHSCGIIHGGMLTKYAFACLSAIDSMQIYILKTSLSKRHLQLHGRSRCPMRKSEPKSNYP